MWTFGRKIALGFAIAFAPVLIVGLVAYRSADSLTQTSYLATHSHLVLEKLTMVLSEMQDAETGQRGFVITGDDAYLVPYQSGSRSVVQTAKDLRDLTVDNAAQQKSLDELAPLLTAKLTELQRVIDLRRKEGFTPAGKVVSSNEGKRAMDDIRRVLTEMDGVERGLLKQRADDVEAAARGARMTIVLGAALALLFVLAVGAFLTRTLSQQIGTAVGQVQSSSAELQSASTQQATGSRQQSTAMSEISTTISELLATSRQITESAQRVAEIAGQTAIAARSGDETVDTAHELIAGIRRQVDLIVNHMLQLGKKSQQIGSVVEIVAELAEQTNILAINATIEAAGAGDAGKRFAVVAEEIRKLADRVAGSAKEIRGLIEDVRGAVNTTVMATETGSKAVDAGSKQFGHVAASFKQIAGLVATTTEAAREIELSTKQQMTAVEQVNDAIGNVAQASKETEISSGQTQQTAVQLATLSKELLRLVHPGVAA
jgi:methyl-accepting chemotaxis protein